MLKTIPFLFLIWFFSALCHDTNVKERLLWKTKSIDYVLAGDEFEKGHLRELVNETVTELKNNVGDLITWNEILLEESRRIDRSIIFIYSNTSCGHTSALAMGPTYVKISEGSTCDSSINLHYVLQALGFIPTHLRHDRDRFIIIHWDNILPINHQNYEKCSSCKHSDDKSFDEYDINSILHDPQYSPWAYVFCNMFLSENEQICRIDSSKPVISPINSSLTMNKSRKGRTMTALDIRQFKAIYETAFM